MFIKLSLSKIHHWSFSASSYKDKIVSRQMFTLDCRSTETQTNQWSLMNKWKCNQNKNQQVKNRWVNDHSVEIEVISHSKLIIYMLSSSPPYDLQRQWLTLLPSSKKKNIWRYAVSSCIWSRHSLTSKTKLRLTTFWSLKAPVLRFAFASTFI